MPGISQHLGIDSSTLSEAVGIIGLLYVRADRGNTERLRVFPKSQIEAAANMALHLELCGSSLALVTREG